MIAENIGIDISSPPLCNRDVGTYRQAQVVLTCNVAALYKRSTDAVNLLQHLLHNVVGFAVTNT